MDTDELVVILAGIAVFAVLAFVWVVRERRAGRLRIGFFIERERYDDEDKD